MQNTGNAVVVIASVIKGGSELLTGAYMGFDMCLVPIVCSSPASRTIASVDFPSQTNLFPLFLSCSPHKQSAQRAKIIWLRSLRSWTSFLYWTESLHAKNWISDHLISLFFVSFVHLTCSFWRSRQSQPSCSVVFLCFSLIFPASFQPFCHRPLIFKSPNACFCPSTLCVLIFYIHSHERIIVKGVQVN